MPLTKITSKGIIKILRTKTAHQLIQKRRHLIAGSKKESIRSIEKAMPNRDVLFHTTDSTSRRFGPHAQPNPRRGNDSHVYDGNRWGLKKLGNLTRDQAKLAYRKKGMDVHVSKQQIKKWSKQKGFKTVMERHGEGTLHGHPPGRITTTGKRARHGFVNTLTGVTAVGLLGDKGCR